MNAVATITEEIHELSFKEKFVIVSTIWEEIHEKVEEVENEEISPAIKAILDERLRDMESGKAEFIEWDEAVRMIRER